MEERYLSAGRAAEELGVSLATLYAYVSRGLVRSEAVEGKKRNRRYRAEDVRRLRERKERRRDPDGVLEGALHWGTPVMESGIALIADGRLHYRGRDVVDLAGKRSIEEVAALIWTGEEAMARDLFPPEEFEPSERIRTVVESVTGMPPVEVFQVLLPLAAAEDPAAYDLRPGAVARTGARILRLMTSVASGEDAPGLAETLGRGWSPRVAGAGALLDAAMVLCADHELPVSTFAARCVASSGANPYAVVLAGLAALGGVKHGGGIELVETFLREVEVAGNARAVISGRLRRGERIPGFGHSLYPEGDPRGAALLRLTADAYPEGPAVELSEAVTGEVLRLMGGLPNVDFALATVARALGVPAGGAVALFGLGRTVGWIGHAIEQYEGDSLIRPRARYVGEQPREVSGGG
ncbi:MAG: 2-methylcitrate synthase [uncultured Rubrobacteraceae bacterium]|uniref:citrate synthase (unknown stereospecificity) n=1 Tax=uncultured Rubrobacteraceae bacterium TaxID=349277 RepID=A0A6J4PV22_9ACTN|nr:MAG: 2-methylcitrate synthase [uncultured Rubrobacteraceae bacterium]